MKRNSERGRVQLRGQAPGLVSQAGVELLYRTAAASGLETALTTQLAGFGRARSAHDPGKIVMDLVVTLAAGGDCPADTAMLRGGHGLFGPVASDPTISRLIHRLAGDPAGPTPAGASAPAPTTTSPNAARKARPTGKSGVA